MRLSEFNFFELKDEDIALYPPMHRDECKLMVIHRKSGTIDMFRKDEPEKFLTFRNVLDYFDEGDTFVMNDTKVFPARLYGTKEKTDAKIEVFLLRELNPTSRLWDVLVEPARKIRIGNKLFFDESGAIVAEVIDNTTSRGRTLRFINESEDEDIDLKDTIFAMGEAPLPYYIMEKRQSEPEDMENFQCIFARNEGAVTAPCSGMHFSREMMKIMEIKDINTAFVTMHCSLANFNTIDVEDLSKHKMDSEQMVVNAKACEMVNNTKLSGHHVIAVGTSVVRTMETAVGTDGLLKEYDGWTSKFIFPPYNCVVADSMIGNFYHPLSTMLMIECAFGGYDLVKESYELALENGYKFGCYGDAMLILND